MVRFDQSPSYNTGAWAVMGDFNCVANWNERIGSPVSYSKMRDFRQCIGTCDLHDLKSSGAFYTWTNKHTDNSRVYSRIDRVLVSKEWITDLSDSEVHFGMRVLFDHCPTTINGLELRKLLLNLNILTCGA